MCGYAIMLVLPALLGAFVRFYAYDDRQIGLVGSSALVGMTLGTLIVVNLGPRGARIWVVLAGLLLAAGYGLAASTRSFPLGLGAIAVAGIGGGFMQAYAYRVCGRAANPDRMIAAIGVMELAGGAIGFQAVSRALPAVGLQGVLLGLGLLGLVVVVLGATMRETAADRSTTRAALALPPKPALIVLLAFWFYCCGEIGLVAFIERIGLANGLPLGQVSYAMSALQVGGIVTCFLVMPVPPRWSRIPS